MESGSKLMGGTPMNLSPAMPPTVPILDTSPTFDTRFWKFSLFVGNSGNYEQAAFMYTAEVGVRGGLEIAQ